MLFKSRKQDGKTLNIIIVGCGKVGATLTEKLSNAGHNVTIIDKNADSLNYLTDQYDVMGIVGNGASYGVLKEAGIESANLIIAVTDQDELNLLCCTVAKRVGDCAAIARVRTPDYSDEVHYLKDKLGLAMIINPDLVAAKVIARNLSLPEALSVNSFAHGAAEMVTFKVPKGCILHGKKLMNIGHDITADVLICAVERDGKIIIPDGQCVLSEGDNVSFVSTMTAAKDFFNRIGLDTNPVRNTMIVGGGRSAFYLTKMLIDTGVKVKVIESSHKRCEYLSEEIPKATIISGDGTDEALLMEEGLRDADAFVSLTGFDEENILLSLHASEVSTAKTITKINRNTFHNVYNKLDVGSIIYPRQMTAELILAYARGMSASMDSNNVDTLYNMFEGRVEALEFTVKEASKATDKPLKELRTKDNLLISCIIHEGKVIIPRGNDKISVGDRVVVVTSHTGLQDLDDVLA